jgi:hypothetical protein
MAKISDQLRTAIRKYGSVYSVARDSGVAQPVVNRFVRRQRDLKLRTVDRLCDFLGLELKPKLPKRSAKKRKKR